MKKFGGRNKKKMGSDDICVTGKQNEFIPLKLNWPVSVFNALICTKDSKERTRQILSGPKYLHLV